MPPARKNATEGDPTRKEQGRRNPDEALGRSAARQWGALTGEQARKAGLSKRQIDYRIRVKRWRRVARDVFVLAGTRNTWEQQAMVASLSGPPGTVTSHLTAAAVYGLAKAPKEPQVTIPVNGSGQRIKGCRIRKADLRPAEKAVKDWLPCTTPVRTVVDCSELLDGEGVCEMVDSALCRKLMQPSKLIRAAEEALPGARGARRAGVLRLLEALVVWRAGAPPGSPPEAKLQRRLKEWGFPAATRQVEVFGKDGRFIARADVGIVEWKVLLEYDSDERHGPRFWIADDTRVDDIEAETGYRVVPVDRFDLRPSNTNLRDRLEKLRPPGWAVAA